MGVSWRRTRKEVGDVQIEVVMIELNGYGLVEELWFKVEMGVVSAEVVEEDWDFEGLVVAEIAG